MRGKSGATAGRPYAAVLFCLLAAFPLGLSGKSAQAEERYAFDKTHTSISFSVSRLGIFDIDGAFSEYDGDFVFCTGHPEKDAVAITFYPAGIHTSDEDMDKDLRGPDFFDAVHYPQMRFVSTGVTLVDKDHATVTGNLTLLGVTKPVTLDAHFTEKDDDADDEDYVVGFSATAVIQRSDFGMDYLVPIIGDDVYLNIQVQGVKEKRPAKKKRIRSPISPPSSAQPVR